MRWRFNQIFLERSSPWRYALGAPVKRRNNSRKEGIVVCRLKRLGLAFVSILAIGAVGAPGAQATDLIGWSVSKAWVTGTSHDHVLKLFHNGGIQQAEIVCTTAKFTGTAEIGASEVTVRPSYVGKATKHPTERSARVLAARKSR